MDEELRRYEKIRGAYRSVGRLANLYDGMMTYSTWSGKLISRLVWGLDRDGVSRYVGLALRAAHAPYDEIYVFGRQVRALVPRETVLPEELHAAPWELTMEDVFIYYDRRQREAQG